MRKLLVVGAFLAAFTALGFAETWNGTLLDAGCYAEHKQVGTCGATNATKAFAIEVSGKVLIFDNNGNTKASAAMQNRADRSAPGGKNEAKAVAAKVTGSETGGTISVEEIEVR